MSCHPIDPQNSLSGRSDEASALRHDVRAGLGALNPRALLTSEPKGPWRTLHKSLSGLERDQVPMEDAPVTSLLSNLQFIIISGQIPWYEYAKQMGQSAKSQLWADK